MIPKFLEGHRSIAITIQNIEVATNPGDASGFASVQTMVPVPVGLTEMVPEARPARSPPLGT